MPKILTDGIYAFYVHGGDHNPPHVHIVFRDLEARITFDGIVLTNTGFKNKLIKRFIAKIEERRDDFEAAWREYNE